jgi:uncharacterized repeat protein (TIGR01451 family)
MNLRTAALAAFVAALSLFALDAHAQEADLLVLKSSPATATAGSDVSFNITVTNIGPDDAIAATLDDPLPAGMIFVSFGQNTGTAFSCTTPNPGDTTGTVQCTTATLAASSSATFTLVATIPAQTPPETSFTNTATVSTTTFDPNEENNSSSASTSTPAPPQGDLGVSKNGPSFARPDTDVTYTIALTNAGPSAATTVSLTDTLPGTMTFVGITQTGSPTFSCTTPAIGAGGTITCTAGTMAAGATATFQLTGHIPSGTASGTSFTNTATVTSDQDPNEENNLATTDLTVASADVSIVKSAPATAPSGSDVAFTITVTNNGPDPADNIQWSDPLNSNLTFVSLVPSGPAGVSCVTPSVGASGTVTCTIDALLNMQPEQFTLTAHITTPAIIPASISNTATLAPSPSDPNTNNNSSTTTTIVTNVAELGVTKNGPATIAAGTDITYTIDVTNTGPSPAFNVSLTDATPANTTFASIAFPAGWNCTAPAPAAAGTITCTIPRLDPNTPSSFTLTLHVAASAPNGSSIANTATVASTSDSTPLNNSATSTATVVATSDVQVTKNGPAAAGSATNIAYTVIVSNAGPADAQSVVMTDAVPTGSTFVSLSQTGAAFNCTAPAVGGTGTVTCTIATLTFGASTTFTITVTTPPASTLTLSNTANVSSVTTDPNPMNNTASTTTAVSPNPADLSIVKTSNAPSGTLPGEQLTYTLAVANGGPSTANGVSVTDTLPANTTFVSATPTQGSCSGTTTVTCTLGTLTSGANATITIVVTVGPNLGPIVNTATVASTNVDPDPNPANNSSTSTVNVVPTIPSSSPLSLTLLALALAAAGMFATRLRG